MRVQQSFDGAISHFSLMFKRGAMEAKFRAEKEAEFKLAWPRWLMVFVAIFLTIFFCFLINSDSKFHNKARFYAGIASVVTFDGSLVLEFCVHFFWRLRYLRGFCIVMGLSFGATFYSTYVHTVPGVLPGAISMYILCVFANLSFSYNWIFSCVYQVLGQVIVSAIFLVRYEHILLTADGAVPIINVNSSLIYLPFLFYFAERDKRQIAFLHWQNLRETKFWKHLAGALPVGLILARSSDIVYSNDYVTYLLPTNRQDQTHTLTEVLDRVRKHDDPGQTLLGALFGTENSPELRMAKYTYSLGPNDELVLAASLLRFNRADEEYKVCILQDQRVLEELERVRIQVQYQKSFFAMITHELRNPLHGIMGIIEVVKASLPSKEMQRHCEVGLNTSKLMMSLVNDILDVSQLEANKLTLAENWHNFVEAAEECLAIMTDQYQRKKLVLRLEAVPQIPEIFNDRRRFSQIVINLLSNAVKFTQQGGVTVHMSYDQETATLWTSVTDTGVGIRPENVGKLFQLYGKVSSTKDNPQGIGLGLFVCKKLSEQMGGSISVSSVLGQGTTFKFAILNKRPPAAQPKRTTPGPAWAETGIETGLGVAASTFSPNPNLSTAMGAPQEQMLNESSRRLMGPTFPFPFPCPSSQQLLKPPEELQVLIIDDDFSCTHVLKLFCSSLKVHADTAASGEEGVEMVRARLSEPSRPPYELFFLDMHMPGMNGLETATCICDIYRPRDILPTIIALSGDSGDELKFQCHQVGILDLLLKPFGRLELSRVLQRFLLPT